MHTRTFESIDYGQVRAHYNSDYSGMAQVTWWDDWARGVRVPAIILTANRAELLDMLKRLEWTGVRDNCHICGCIRSVGHAPDCELARLLEEVEP